MVCVKDALPYGAKPGALESSAPGVTSDRCGGHGVHSVPTWSRSVNNRNHVSDHLLFLLRHSDRG